MKKQLTSAFLITGLVIGILVTWQFNTEIVVSTNFASDEVEAKEELLKNLLDEQSYLQSRIVTLRESIEESQKVIQVHSEESNLALLEELKKDLGLTEMSGIGVEIQLDDNPSAVRDGAEVVDSQLIQAADIRDIINMLYASNAEAIVVNQQRIIATTPISSVGNSILINNAHVAPPYTIRAIGDQELMIKRLLAKDLIGGIYQRIKEDKIGFEVYRSNSLNLPIYNGDFQADYLNLVE